MRIPICQADIPVGYNKVAKYLARHWPGGEISLSDGRERLAWVLGYTSCFAVSRELVTDDANFKTVWTEFHDAATWRGVVRWGVDPMAFGSLLSRAPWSALTAGRYDNRKLAIHTINEALPVDPALEMFNRRLCDAEAAFKGFNWAVLSPERSWRRGGVNIALMYARCHFADALRDHETDAGIPSDLDKLVEAVLYRPVRAWLRNSHGDGSALPLLPEHLRIAPAYLHDGRYLGMLIEHCDIDAYLPQLCRTLDEVLTVAEHYLVREPVKFNEAPWASMRVGCSNIMGWYNDADDEPTTEVAGSKPSWSFTYRGQLYVRFLPQAALAYSRVPLTGWATEWRVPDVLTEIPSPLLDEEPRQNFAAIRASVSLMWREALDVLDMEGRGFLHMQQAFELMLSQLGSMERVNEDYFEDGYFDSDPYDVEMEPEHFVLLRTCVDGVPAMKMLNRELLTDAVTGTGMVEMELTNLLTDRNLASRGGVLEILPSCLALTAYLICLRGDDDTYSRPSLTANYKAMIGLMLLAGCLTGRFKGMDLTVLARQTTDLFRDFDDLANLLGYSLAHDRAIRDCPKDWVSCERDLTGSDHVSLTRALRPPAEAIYERLVSIHNTLAGEAERRFAQESGLSN